MYKYYNPNPEGRGTIDCVVRALTKVLNVDWERAYIGVCLQGLLLHDYPDQNHVWSEYLYHQGYLRTRIPNTCPDCYTVRDFCYEHESGRYLLACDGHVVAVVNSNYYDAWDSGDEMVLYYWRKDPRLWYVDKE